MKTAMRYIKPMKRRLDKNAGRRGIGIEMAVLVLLVVFGLSGLLVSTAMLEKNNLDKEKAAVAQRMELDRLAEAFCADPKNWDIPEGTPYSANISNDRCTLELMLEEECLLTVVLENDSGVYKVVEWTHH